MCDDTELVLLHQDAFAADYQEDEYMLLGMAIKYAGRLLRLRACAFHKVFPRARDGRSQNRGRKVAKIEDDFSSLLRRAD
jgi:hypothetical protein